MHIILKREKCKLGFMLKIAYCSYLVKHVDVWSCENDVKKGLFILKA